MQVHALNETLINLNGKVTNIKASSNSKMFSNIHWCQLCHLKEHMVFMCPKLIKSKPKCVKCNGGLHKIENYGKVNVLFCFGLGHMEEGC